MFCNPFGGGRLFCSLLFWVYKSIEPKRLRRQGCSNNRGNIEHIRGKSLKNRRGIANKTKAQYRAVLVYRQHTRFVFVPSTPVPPREAKRTGVLGTKTRQQISLQASPTVWVYKQAQRFSSCFSRFLPIRENRFHCLVFFPPCNPLPPKGFDWFGLVSAKRTEPKGGGSMFFPLPPILLTPLG